MQDSYVKAGSGFLEQMLRENICSILVENSPNLIGILQDGLFEYVNRTMCEKLGWTFEEMLSPSFDPIETVIPPRLRERARNAVARSMLGETISPFELSLSTRGGLEISVMSFSQRITYRGKPAEQFVFVDITDLKRAEQALKESERRYKAMFESMGSAVAIYEAVDDGRDFILKDFNSPAEKMEHVRREDVIGQSVRKIFSGVQDFGLFNVFQRVWKTGKSEHYLAELYKDQRILGWRDNYVYKLHSGEIVAIYEDVTERKKMTIEIERLAKFPTENPNPVLRLGLDGTVLDTNRASESLLQEWKCKVGEKAPKFWTDLVDELNTSQSTRSFDVHVGERTFLLTLVPIKDAGYVNVYGRDITERKLAEQAIQHRLEFEATVSKISSSFVGVSDTDNAISTSLADMARLSRASRVYVFLFRENGTIMDNTHEWCAEGVSPQIKALQNLSTDRFPWWMTKLRNGETIQIEDVSKMSPEARAERKVLLEDQDIKSLLVVPFNIGEKLAGFIGFDNVVGPSPWRDSDVALLKVCSKIIGDALERNYMEDSIRHHSDHLEDLVEARTREITQLNLDISHRLAKKIDQIENISRLRDSLRKTSDTSTGLDLVLDGAMKDLQMDAGAVFVFDQKERVINVRASKSKIEGIMLNGSYPLDCGLSDCELLTLDKAISKIEDKSNLLKTTSIHCAPVHLGKEMHGSLILGTQKAMTLDESDLTVLRLYANLASTVFEIENLAITPAKEDVQEGKSRVEGKLEFGTAYLLKNEVEKTFEFFTETVLSGVEGLCITREYPPKIREKYGLKKTPIVWLSEEKMNGQITVYSLQDLSIMIANFLVKVNRGMVLLDGVEYLVTNHGFESFLRFLQVNRSRFESLDSVLIIPVTEGTISEKELRLIERETKMLKISCIYIHR